MLNQPQQLAVTRSKFATATVPANIEALVERFKVESALELQAMSRQVRRFQRYLLNRPREDPFWLGVPEAPGGFERIIFVLMGHALTGVTDCVISKLGQARIELLARCITHLPPDCFPKVYIFASGGGDEAEAFADCLLSRLMDEGVCWRDLHPIRREREALFSHDNLWKVHQLAEAEWAESNGSHERGPWLFIIVGSDYQVGSLLLAHLCTTEAVSPFAPLLQHPGDRLAMLCAENPWRKHADKGVRFVTRGGVELPYLAAPAQYNIGRLVDHSASRLFPLTLYLLHVTSEELQRVANDHCPKEFPTRETKLRDVRVPATLGKIAHVRRAIRDILPYLNGNRSGRLQ